jgi:hypothetical protein
MKFFRNVEIIGADVTQIEYRAQQPQRGDPDYTMGRSDLMEFLLNPHKWLKGAEDDSTESTEWGSLMDTLYLTPQYFDNSYAIIPENYPSTGMQCPKCKSITDANSCRKCGVDRVKIKQSKPWEWSAEYCKDWKEKMIAAGKIIVKQKIIDRATKAQAAMSECKEATELLAVSQRQVMVIGEYHDPETGLVIPVKSLMDFVPDVKHPKWGKTLGDLKTAVSCNPPTFEKTIFDRHYDAQAALYKDLYIEATGEDRPDWVFIVQENKPPYEVAQPFPVLGEDFLEIGRSKYRFALKFYARCLKTNTWPSYSTGTRLVDGNKYICQPRDWMVLKDAERPSLPDLPETETAQNENSDEIIP